MPMPHTSQSILIVEDSEDDRALYRRTLEKDRNEGYVIVEADDGEEGLRHIQQESPACILLDYSLPGRNGVEVLKRIRAKHPFVPVVMLTGQGNEAVAVTAIQEGAQNYIAKSAITSEALQRAIRMAIEHCALQLRIHQQRESLEIFTRALAHDLREPVRTIRSFLDLIHAHETLPEKARLYFNYIYDAAERMNTLIDTVYFYTRLEALEQEIGREVCDVARVLDEAKENLGELIATRRAVITTDPLPRVYANRMQLIQVFQNLLCNAIRHCETAPAIHVHAGEGAEQWLFRVSDNGPGVPVQYSEKIFEPFKRMSRHKEQGLGLGLAICRRIVESHTGKIWYESNPEAGATFLFTLPKALPKEKTAPQASPGTTLQPIARAGDERELASILLVEDNAADVELARILLLEEGRLKCTLLTAHDGYEALSMLRDALHSATRVDLLLIDINMPGMDGFELLERIQTDDALKHIPAVMCTTSTYDKDIERAKALGVAGYLSKPAELGTLSPLLEKISGLRLCRSEDDYTLLRVA